MHQARPHFDKLARHSGQIAHAMQPTLASKAKAQEL